MWISSSIPRLELLANKGSFDREPLTSLPVCSLLMITDDREAETLALSAQLSLSLFLIQGVVLHHDASKRYTGKKYALEVSYI
jgi:hypothetical protein